MVTTDTQLDNEYRSKLREAFTKERDALRQYLLETSKRSDGAVLALAGGGLALSVTFLENIARAPAVWTLPVLGTSWLLLIATIFTSIN